MRLAKQGKLITHHTDRAILTLMNLNSVIEKEYTAVNPDMELGQLVNAISMSRTSFLPVLDDAGRMLGEVDITKIRQVIFRIELYHRFKVRQLMTPPSATVGENDPMEDVVKKFDKTNANLLPVLANDGRLIGYITRERVYSMYRKMVADMSED